MATPNTIPRLTDPSVDGVNPLGLFVDCRTWKLEVDADWILEEIVL